MVHLADQEALIKGCCWPCTVASQLGREQPGSSRFDVWAPGWHGLAWAVWCPSWCQPLPNKSM